MADSELRRDEGVEALETKYRLQLGRNVVLWADPVEGLHEPPSGRAPQTWAAPLASAGGRDGEVARIAGKVEDGVRISAEEALASPHALVGSVEQCVEEVQQWRERWGISYIGINAEEIDAFAPVIAALDGA